MTIHLQENVPLRDLTTFRIGGIARYFVAVGDVAGLKEAVAFAKKKRIHVLVLGGGSNTLIANGKIDALVVKIEIKGIEWESKILPFLKGGDQSGEGFKSSGLRPPPLGKEESLNGGFVTVVVGAGESWDGFVAKTVKRGLWGFENLSGIPGTVGAAPIQNIGAYGAEVKDATSWVEVFDIKTGKVKKLTNKECQFGYRDSIFKKPEGKGFIITRVAFRLTRNSTPNLGYKDLENYFMPRFSPSLEGENKRGGAHPTSILPSKDGGKETPTLFAIRRAVLEIRSKKFPDLRKHGTAGSFFKNPIISQEKFNVLTEKYPALPGFELKVSGQKSMVKLSLAWILDNICGLKGFKKGGVGLFEKQPIVLVNSGGASAKEIQKFADEIIARVKEKTGIDIEPEVQSIG